MNNNVMDFDAPTLTWDEEVKQQGKKIKVTKVPSIEDQVRSGVVTQSLVYDSEIEELKQSLVVPDVPDEDVRGKANSEEKQKETKDESK